jgi:hypothetical protein
VKPYHRTRAARAQQIYAVLIGYAARRQTLTYGQLGDLIRFKEIRFIGQFLNPIMAYCEREDIPPLTSIVVDDATGLPGDGFNSRDKPLCENQSDVYHHDWFGFYPPSLADLGNEPEATE